MLCVLYTTNKYMLPDLEKLCRDFLENNLCATNVCTVLDQVGAFVALRTLAIHELKNNKSEQLLDILPYNFVNTLSVKRCIYTDFRNMVN